MNQLFQGDNLEILHNMPGGSVDLICTDPPFNTGKDWGAFDDRWEGGLDEYLKFMEARVVECGGFSRIQDRCICIVIRRQAII